MGGFDFLILLLPLVALWFLILRPAQRRQREALALRDALRPGIDIVTTAGLLGTITQVDDDEVTVSVAPGVELRMVKAAIGQVRPAVADMPPSDAAEDVSADPDATGGDAPRPD